MILIVINFIILMIGMMKTTLFSTSNVFFVDKNNIITEIYVGTDW